MRKLGDLREEEVVDEPGWRVNGCIYVTTQMRVIGVYEDFYAKEDR